MVEKKLYRISDTIGCLSPANVNYLARRFPEVSNKLEVNPNCIDLSLIPVIEETKKQIRSRWDIPLNATVFLYGGNLGKPQGLDFLLEIINACKHQVPDAYFLIVGDGTDYRKITDWFKLYKPVNARIIQKLAKNDFDPLAYSCDVGLILLRKEFTIPNFPSRLLSYLENKIPVLAITDINSDIGKIAEKNNFGKWVLYGDLEESIKQIIFFNDKSDYRQQFGENGFSFLLKNYSSVNSFQLINHS
jgi:glycosyltransferase involved in cell wall biosynthesis